MMDFYTILTNKAYPTPFANSPLLPLLLLSLATQKNAPATSKTFNAEYDYIIVGAGSAGSVVASRLSEVPCVSVLLLEAGRSPPLINDVPAISRSFWYTDMDWAYKTVPQKHSGFGLINNQFVWPRGKGLGGSSLLNDMLYVRGNRENYDDWARLGAVGWSYSDVKPYFLKSEDNRDPEFLENGYHVADGPLSVHKQRYDAEIKNPIIESAKLLGYNLVDANGRIQRGFVDPQLTVRNAQRCSTAKAFLVPAENRTNLDIVTQAFVKKVLIEGDRAVGVQFDLNGLTYSVMANKEVILSAGAVNTPQLLMLSGIGPRKHLQDLGIEVVADLPVGDGMQDHVRVPVHFQIDPRIPSIQQKFLSPKIIEDYVNNRTGILTSVVQLLAFLSAQEPSAKDNPDVQLHFLEISSQALNDAYGLKQEVYQRVFGPYENASMCICFSQNMHPNSRGTIRLQSTNPYDKPLIEPNYYGDPRDIKDLVAGMKKCIEVISSAPMREVKAKLSSEIVPGCETLTGDIYLDCVARTLTLTNHHPVGTAKMGDPRDTYTVVDSQLRVKFLNNLRVVDASIMPTIPSANTNAVTIMVAEKASDLIKNSINCLPQAPSYADLQWTPVHPISPIATWLSYGPNVPLDSY